MLWLYYSDKNLSDDGVCCHPFLKRTLWTLFLFKLDSGECNCYRKFNLWSQVYKWKNKHKFRISSEKSWIYSQFCKCLFSCIDL